MLYLSILFAVISSVTLNGLILFTIYKKKRKILPLEIFIINLAVVDICIAVLAYPFSSVSSMSHRWLIGDIGQLTSIKLYWYKFRRRHETSYNPEALEEMGELLSIKLAYA